MKHCIVKSGLLLALLTCLLSVAGYPQAVRVSADSLTACISSYIGKKVEVEGVVAHMCGVDGRKMKIQSATGAEVEVIANEQLGSFDFSLNKKRVRVWGTVKEARIDGAFADRMERDQALLCSIDSNPCKDSAWVERQRRNGTATDHSRQSIAKLRERIAASGRGYLSITIVVADRVEVVE
ncbi:hypothetical protein [uncultured Acetobacteroides sp.]|uniref:hypothetical protein n=1 Tax=uncultured Acetobacteroides sp. TaxID=1760811 RepID=UPI0029F59D25|nr:hypothetical protein [uncultured Acetobacteroides sp.]